MKRRADLMKVCLKGWFAVCIVSQGSMLVGFFCFLEFTFSSLNTLGSWVKLHECRYRRMQDIFDPQSHRNRCVSSSMPWNNMTHSLSQSYSSLITQGLPEVRILKLLPVFSSPIWQCKISGFHMTAFTIPIVLMFFIFRNISFVAWAAF